MTHRIAIGRACSFRAVVLTLYSKSYLITQLIRTSYTHRQLQLVARAHLAQRQRTRAACAQSDVDALFHFISNHATYSDIL